MRERAADRLVSVVLRLVIAESKRFCMAPISERRLSTSLSAESRAASGFSVATWVESSVTPLTSLASAATV